MVVRVAVVEWMVVDVVSRTFSVVVVVEVVVVVVVVVDTECQVAGVAADDVAAVGGVGRHGRVQKCRMKSKIVTFVMEKLHIGPQHVLRHGVWVASRLHYSVYPARQIQVSSKQSVLQALELRISFKIEKVKIINFTSLCTY